MLKRLYIHNFRCLDNFELKPAANDTLLLGKNGAGKSTVAAVLNILRKVAGGQSRVGDMLKTDDFAYGRVEIPVRFELEVLINGHKYKYCLLLELPAGFKEPRVAEERLECDDNIIFSRELAQISLIGNRSGRNIDFAIDWHLCALSIIQVNSNGEPLAIFRDWLAQMLILAPVPSLINGQANEESLVPRPDCTDFADWLSGMLVRFPAAYTTIDKFLHSIMPDLKDFTFESIGGKAKLLKVRFSQKNAASHALPFEKLSDGEKCLFVGALVIAANEYCGPLMCFWDEPDSYLSLAEVGRFIIDLRKAFGGSGQLMVSSHNSEAISKFSDETTLVFQRNSHLEPVTVRTLSEINYSGLIDSIIIGEI